MLTFISCAKTMASHADVPVPYRTEPVYLTEAESTAKAIAGYPAADLMDMMHTSPAIAAEVKEMYGAIIRDEAERLPAILAYTGAVFKRINPRDFSSDDFSFAQKHLRITSFLYGLLRPLDLISPYRLEGSVRLNGMDMFSRWRPLLTDMFISEIQENGGILADLASEEMKGLFDWKRVASEVRVVRPEFMTEKDDRLKTVTIHAKMCRGEMTGMIIRHRIEDPARLREFRWNGFQYDADCSDGDRLVFVRKA